MKTFNLVVPLAGKAQRFLDKGFKMPKPLIMVGNKMIIEKTMECIDYSDCNLIFVVREDHVSNFAIDQILKKKFGNDIKIVISKEDTDGSVSSVMLAKKLIDNTMPLIIHCSDVWFETKTGKFNPNKISNKLDGHLLVFKSNSPNYSYVELDDSHKVIRTAEKLVISNLANCGIYYFKSGGSFVGSAERMRENKDTTKGEYFIAPLYNTLIDIGCGNITVDEVKKMHIFGTPNELAFYNNCVVNQFGLNSVVALCSDHSGYDLKEEAKTMLEEANIKYIDYGCHTDHPSDYFDFASLAAKAIQERTCTHAMAFCRTGQGQNIVGNKFKNVRAGLISDVFTATMSIEHNCCNWFSIPSKYVNDKQLYNMIHAMMDTSFEGGRHQVRVQKIWELDNANI